MHVLLDTHAFLWFAADSTLLSSRARETIRRADTVQVSVVSVWELAIKYASGKFVAPDEHLPTLVLDCIRECNATLLPVRIEHALAVAELPFHHRDPFDRMLVAQAIHEELTLISNDPFIGRYSYQVLW